MATENQTWDYTRIRGGLKRLGHDVARNTIKAILKDHGIEPAPERGTKTPWKTCLAAHWHDRCTLSAEAGKLNRRKMYGLYGSDNTTLMSLVAASVADGVEVILGSHDQTIANEGRSCESHFLEIVGVKQFIVVAGTDHERLAFFVHTKDLVAVAPGR